MLAGESDKAAHSIAHLIASGSPPRSVIVAVGRPQRERGQQDSFVGISRFMVNALKVKFPNLRISAGTTELGSGDYPELLNVLARSD
jgi:hypothetical protein